MADQVFAAVCGFWDAVNHDRLYTADDMNKPYSRIIADGVFATQEGTPSADLQVVSAGIGMQITVQGGQGIFAHKWFENPSPILITVPDNNTLYSRIDSVIVQVDKRTEGRVGNIVYREGTADASPTAPAINTVSNVLEWRVANISITPTTSAITNAEITDLRGSADCPWVTSLIKQVDTSTLWNQFAEAYQQQFDKYTEDYQEYTEAQAEAWAAFIEQLTQELTVTTNVVLLDSIYATQGTTTDIPINISGFNYHTDVLQVYINGLFTPEGTKWNILPSLDTIHLSHPLPAGNVVYFVALKSLVNGNVDSTTTMTQRLADNVSNFMQDSGIVPLDLASGVYEYLPALKPSFRKIGKRVYIRGAIKNATTAGTAIGVIPAAFRPDMDYTFTSSAISSGEVKGNVTIKISAGDGTITLSAIDGTIDATDMISIATNYLAATGFATSIVYSYCGSVTTYGDLPASGMVAGDVYTVETADAQHNIASGDDVMWNGEDWELLNAAISSSEIDAIIDTIE